MFKNKVISIVVPANNEQKLIQKVLQSIPHWIDHIYVIDDCSLDATSEKVRERMAIDTRVQLIRNEENRGVGAVFVRDIKPVLKARSISLW